MAIVVRNSENVITIGGQSGGIPDLGDNTVTLGNEINPIQEQVLGSGSGIWGSITGNLTDQTDLVQVLNTKELLVNKDTDGTLNANSDTKYPSQKAVKTYVDNHSSSITIASQAEAEAGTDNTKVMTSLRVLQSITYQIVNYVFTGLSTTSKTIQGAINELFTNKVDKNANITGATKTKVTYDSKGLVTSGTDAALSDLTDDSTHRLVSDTEKSTWNSKQNSIANTDALSEGSTNKYFTESRVLATVLTGISFVTSTAIVATDTILQAFGKLQAQITFLFYYMFVDQTTSYTLVIGDSGKKVRMNVGTANTLTIPPNSSAAFTIGVTIVIRQIGTGITTITPGAGVTINAPGGTLAMPAQYSEAFLVKENTDLWSCVFVGSGGSSTVPSPTADNLVSMDASGNLVNSNVGKGQVLKTTDISVADFTAGETRLMSVKEQAGSAVIGSAIKLLDQYLSSSISSLLGDTAAWGNVSGKNSDYLQITGDNRTGGLGETGQWCEILGTYYQCISHITGTTSGNGSATYVRNNNRHFLNSGITNDASIIALLTSETNWNTTTQTLTITTLKCKVGSMYTAPAGYIYICFDESGTTFYWKRFLIPDTYTMSITDATLQTELQNNNWTTTAILNPAATVKGSQGQEWAWEAPSGTSNYAKCVLIGGNVRWIKIK